MTQPEQSDIRAGNFVRTARIAGTDWIIDVELSAATPEGYERAKQAIRDLVTEPDGELSQPPPQDRRS